MTLFLGYDPGGNGNHGLAAARIRADGSFCSKPETTTVATARDAWDWISQFEAVVLGIDTLLCWSSLGKRACDDGLKQAYPRHQKSVVPQNSLYSAMTLNGVIVGERAAQQGLKLVESHPKLLLKVVLDDDPQAIELVALHQNMLVATLDKRAEKRADDKGDAIVAAWCASRWYFKKWTCDLYAAFDDDLTYPVGRAAYPWPRHIGEKQH